MNDPFLFAYLQEHGDFAEWAAKSPVLADRVARALITLGNLDRSLERADLLLCRDAALSLHTIAREGGFYDVAAVFSLLSDQFSRALLPFTS